jgi:cytochrome c
MKQWGIMMVILLASSSAWGFGDEGDSNRGKALFESTKLGSNGKSCVSCHPGGSKLEWPATFPEDKLSDAINNCISKALKGKPLPTESAELKSLIRYIKSFAGP